ncbi:hypothetical protein [Bosea sp. AAP35]|nr:hypothetical protein [Bosea sp. AAP35]
MRAVYIHCPETGLAVDTGMVSETTQLSHITLQGTIEVCPAC